MVLRSSIPDEWTPTVSLGLRAGVRALHLVGGATEWLPRLGARLALSPELSLSLGAGRYGQVMRSLRSEESIGAAFLAYDLLTAVSGPARISTAEDVVLGAEWAAAGTSVRVDGYLKRMRRLVLVPPPADAMNAPVFTLDSLEAGEGFARGIEVLARHRRGEAELSLSYALAFAELEAGGTRYAPRFERRHTIDATAALPLGRRGLASAHLALATGQPYTPAIGLIRAYQYRHDGDFLDGGFGGYATALLLAAGEDEGRAGVLRRDLPRGCPVGRALRARDRLPGGGLVHGAAVVPGAPEVIEPVENARVAVRARQESHLGPTDLDVRWRPGPGIGESRPEVSLQAVAAFADGKPVPGPCTISYHPIIDEPEVRGDALLRIFWADCWERVHASTARPIPWDSVQAALTLPAFDTAYARFRKEVLYNQSAKATHASAGLTGAYGIFGAVVIGASRLTLVRARP